MATKLFQLIDKDVEISEAVIAINCIALNHPLIRALSTISIKNVPIVKCCFEKHLKMRLAIKTQPQETNISRV